jgi:methionine-S-sulfoxide reductase
VEILVMSSADMHGGRKDVGLIKKATFAGGCFWCMQPPYDKIKGVISTRAGYTGGHKKNPTYEEVCRGATGHAEAVEVTYDPSQISYQELLALFWRNIDPTAKDRQFADQGTQYRTAIFYHDDEQRRLAVESKEALEQSGKFPHPVVTEIVPASEFYPAEDYHQAYYVKNPVRYGLYRVGSGRESFIRNVWGDLSRLHPADSGRKPGPEDDKA